MSQKTYRIGEAAAKLKLKSYVLRFWETEFSQISPIRTEKGQRLYTESDLIVLSRIRYLLHERGLTIDGARRLLREEAEKGTLFGDADILPSDEALNDLDNEAPDDIEGDSEDDSEGDPEADSDGGLEGGSHGSAGSPGSVDESAVGSSSRILEISTRAFPVPRAGETPVQGSLFPAAPSGKGVFSEAELREILTELAAIHHLLVFEIPGDTP